MDDLTLFSHDWSRQGVFLRTRDPLKTGTQVILSVLLPGEHRHVEFPAMVVRTLSEADAENQHRPPGMGLYFEEMPPSLVLYLSQLAHGTHLHPDDPARMDGTRDVVLLVGDTGVERLQTSIYLDQMGMDVAEAADTEQAIDLLTSGLRPRAVILFVDELNIMAEHFLDKLHEMPARRPQSTLVVGNSGGGNAALKHHATFFITRPVNPERLYGLMGLAVPAPADSSAAKA